MSTILWKNILSNRQCTDLAKHFFKNPAHLGKKKSVEISVMKKTCTRSTLCDTLPHTATHCNTLQHTATHRNTQQHTATRCNALQHTATQIKKLMMPLWCIHRGRLVYIYGSFDSYIRPVLCMYRVLLVYVEGSLGVCLGLLWETTCTPARRCWKPIGLFGHTATPCNTLQHPATPCNTLQHPATPCHTVQRPATPCNT